MPKPDPDKFGGCRHATSGRRVGLFRGVERSLEILAAITGLYEQ